MPGRPILIDDGAIGDIWSFNQKEENIDFQSYYVPNISARFTCTSWGFYVIRTSSLINIDSIFTHTSTSTIHVFMEAAASASSILRSKTPVARHAGNLLLQLQTVVEVFNIIQDRSIPSYLMRGAQLFVVVEGS